MNKKFVLLFLPILFLFSAATSVTAQTPTPTGATPTTKAGLSEKLNEQINELKEKIASRVSELNLVEKRGIIGTVTEVSGNKITLKDTLGKIRFVDVDEITKFSSTGNKSFGLSDLTKGTKVSVLGLYNKQSKRILARFINTSVDPLFISGTITNIDKKNFLVTILTSDKKQIKLDIQTSSKILTYDKTDGVIKLGFSKLALGDRIVAIGFPDKKDPAIIIPDRVIDLANLPKNPQIVVPDSDASESAR